MQLIPLDKANIYLYQINFLICWYQTGFGISNCWLVRPFFYVL